MELKYFRVHPRGFANEYVLFSFDASDQRQAAWAAEIEERVANDVNASVYNDAECRMARTDFRFAIPIADAHANYGTPPHTLSARHAPLDWEDEIEAWYRKDNKIKA